jgi:hypothetical protein
MRKAHGQKNAARGYPLSLGGWPPNDLLISTITRKLVARSWARSALLRGSKHDKYQHVYYYSRLRSRGVIPFEAGRANCFPQSDLPDTLLKRGIIMHWRVAEHQQDLTTDR